MLFFYEFLNVQHVCMVPRVLLIVRDLMLVSQIKNTAKNRNGLGRRMCLVVVFGVCKG